MHWSPTRTQHYRRRWSDFITGRYIIAERAERVTGAVTWWENKTGKKRTKNFGEGTPPRQIHAAVHPAEIDLYIMCTCIYVYYYIMKEELVVHAYFFFFYHNSA